MDLQVGQVECEDVVGIRHLAGPRGRRFRGDRPIDDQIAARHRRAVSRFARLRENHVEQFPVADEQFACGELPDDDLFAGQAVFALGQLAAEYLARGVRPVVVP